ncbi:hypothetical protein [Microterricola pindariensis]|uniref:hypothetical protein n=1 Tax=Microterricola pindariensis TaxID=478010 RepID=UPI001E2DE905|nr:hypothetical protein [Microterricola pindariensis]
MEVEDPVDDRRQPAGLERTPSSRAIWSAPSPALLAAAVMSTVSSGRSLATSTKANHEVRYCIQMAVPCSRSRPAGTRG